MAAFLARTAALPFAWGAQDCCLWAAEWVAVLTGRDPLRAWRGRYRTAAGAARLVQRGGGLGPLALARMGDEGFALTPAPAPGDVGLVVDDAGQTLAIRLPAGWATKTARGFRVDANPTLLAWSIPCLPR